MSLSVPVSLTLSYSLYLSDSACILYIRFLDMASLGKSCATTSMWKPDAQFLLTLNYMLMSHHKCWIRNDYVILDLYLINSHKDR